MADRRFARAKAKLQMPHWIRQFLPEGKDISSNNEDALEKIRTFLLEMAQPFVFDPKNLMEIGPVTSE